MPIGGMSFEFQLIGPCLCFIEYNCPICCGPYAAKLFKLIMSCSMSTVAPPLHDVAPTWQQSCILLSPVIKFGSLQTQTSLYVLLIPSQFCSCLHPCTVQLWPLTCLCGWIQNIHYNACWQLTLYHLHMPVLMLQLLSTV
jgi:hypothetical protein